jgi:hypothetical protein
LKSQNNYYSFNLHQHNFAIWTASRAVQRNFTTTENIAKAIEESGLRNFVESTFKISKNDFNDFHVKCAKKIIYSLQVQNCTYGIAAKIIAIYLKTTFVLSNKGRYCENIHPPLDRILITNFLKQMKIKEYTYKPWTQLNQKEYWILIDIIEKYNGDINWKLEKFWKI